MPLATASVTHCSAPHTKTQGHLTKDSCCTDLTPCADNTAHNATARWFPFLPCLPVLPFLPFFLTFLPFNLFTFLPFFLPLFLFFFLFFYFLIFFYFLTLYLCTFVPLPLYYLSTTFLPFFYFFTFVPFFFQKFLYFFYISTFHSFSLLFTPFHSCHSFHSFPDPFQTLSRPFSDPFQTLFHTSSVALKHARNGHAQCDPKTNTALAQQSLSKTSIGVRSLPFPPSTCPSVVVSAPVTYAAHGAERTLPSVSLEDRSSSRGPSPTSLAVSSSFSSSVSPSVCFTV